MTLLNWRDAGHFDHSGDQPCAMCDKPTPLRSDNGKPVHKVCAEKWLDTHSAKAGESK